MRFACLLALAVCIFCTDGCGRLKERRRKLSQKRRNDQIERAEGIAAKPQDILFINFEKNWRQFVSQAPVLALPVVRAESTAPWEPLVTAECVYSADAGRMVPQMTLQWNEMPDSSPKIAQRAQQQNGAPELPIRFDLGLHQEAFSRNYFSSALATDKLKRFTLPPNSALQGDPRAVLLTGPGLFPRLLDFKTEALVERDTNRPFTRQTIVLRDLNPALTYTLRMSRLAGDEWNGERQFAFVTPACPNSF